MVEIDTGWLYAGLVASLLRRPLRRMLDRTLQGELEHLKAEAERQDRQA